MCMMDSHRLQESAGTPSTSSSDHLEHFDASFAAWSPSSSSPSTGSSLPASPAAPVPRSSVLEQLGLLQIKHAPQTQALSNPVAALARTHLDRLDEQDAVTYSSLELQQGFDEAMEVAALLATSPTTMWGGTSAPLEVPQSFLQGPHDWWTPEGYPGGSWEAQEGFCCAAPEPAGAPGLTAPPGLTSPPRMADGGHLMPPGLACLPSPPEAWIPNELLTEIDMCGEESTNHCWLRWSAVS